MADGGSIPLTMASDRFSTHKWAAIGIDTHFLFGLSVDDFEVLQPLDPTSGPKKDGRIKLTFDCRRNDALPTRAPMTCTP